MIGERVRRDLFGFEPALGRPLEVNDQWLIVVGVLEGTANDIYLPVTQDRQEGDGAGRTRGTL